MECYILDKFNKPKFHMIWEATELLLLHSAGRRHLMMAMGAAVLGAGVPLTARAQSTQYNALRGKTFVLVHGAFHGGWCWSKVRDILQIAGHRVFTPTMTGFGERAHLLSSSLTLQSCVDDIVAVIEAEELNDIILVGHSFGGLPTTGVIDQVHPRLSHAVLLDSSLAVSNTPLIDLLPAPVREARLKSITLRNGVEVFSPPPAESFGLKREDDIAWVTRRMTTMPANVYKTGIGLTGVPGGTLSKTYIQCTNPIYPAAAAGAEYAKKNGWDFHQLACGHDAMIDAPAELAAILMNIS